MSRLVLDVTELAGNPIRTGIQRVVRALIRYWPATPRLELARFEPGRGLLRLPAAALPLLIETGDGADAMTPPALAEALRAMAAAEAPVAVDEEVPVLVPEVFYEAGRCRWYRERQRLRPDATAFIVYDFIPWLWPDLIQLRASMALMPYLQLVRDSRRTAFISARTRADCATRIRRDTAPAGPVLPLGADGLGLERRTFRPELDRWVALGSINGAKNQDRIAAAFEALWADGFEGGLTLIGRVYGATPPWLVALRCRPRFSHFEDVDDDAVRTALRAARATIYVSEVEGFGLPPVESLHAGIPVITAANIPSIADLPPAGQLRLASPTVAAIREAVLTTAEPDAAARLWREAAGLTLPTWRDLALRTAAWIEVSAPPRPAAAAPGPSGP